MGHSNGMEISSEAVKAWLDKHEDRDRYWLARQCETEKKTVDNWLSSQRGIPAKAALTIERLMRADEELEAQKNRLSAPDLERFSIECEIAEFDAFNRAAMKHGSIVREWALEVLKAAAQSDQSTDVPTGKKEEGEEEEADNLLPFELPFLGAVAAGEPVEAPRSETVSVGKEYAAGHFVVEINGRSGEPEFYDGERWIIDGRNAYTPKNGKPCIVSDGFGSYLKKWNRTRGVFESINPDFPDVIPAEGAKFQGYPVEKL